MTYAQIQNRIRLIIDLSIDYISLIRDAENEFIRKSNCTQKMSTIDTSTLTLTNIYTLPTDFVEETRVEWEGTALTKMHQGSTEEYVYDMSDNIAVGWIEKYWIESGSIRLNAKPSANGKFRIWHSYINEVTNGTSPIIPINDHDYLQNYVFSIIYQMETNPFKDVNRAFAYKAQFEKDARMRNLFYQSQRLTQTRIIDVSQSNVPGIQSLIGIVTP